MQDQDALVPATRDMQQLKVLRFDGCGVSTLAAYRLLKTCPDTQLQCWPDGELLFLLTNQRLGFCWTVLQLFLFSCIAASIASCTLYP